MRELTFDDLYIEDDEVLYLNIQEAIGSLITKIKNKKRMHIHTGESEDGLFGLVVRGMQSNRIKHTGL